MRKSRPDHVAEVVSVLVTPTPLDGLQITDKAQKLSEAQVANWEKSWGIERWPFRDDSGRTGLDQAREGRDYEGANCQRSCATASFLSTQRQVN